jgi:hypothetical protein
MGTRSKVILLVTFQWVVILLLAYLSFSLSPW